VAGIAGNGLALGLVIAAQAGANSIGGTGKPQEPTVSGVRGAGSSGKQSPGEIADGPEAESEAHGGTQAGGTRNDSSAGLVANVAGKGADGKRDGSDPGGTGFSALPGQTPDTAPGTVGPHVRPNFVDLLGQAPVEDARSAVAVQRAVLTDVPVGRVPIEIGLRSLECSNQFEIRLSPDELGRVDVRLDIDRAGEVKAHLVVERPEALALLTRERGQLERAFEQAGLKPADGGIAFSLRDGSADSGGRGTGRESDQPQGRGGAPVPGLADIAAASMPVPLPRAVLTRLGALDLTI
jgi:hypothetical protein